MTDCHAKTSRAAVVLHEQGVAIQMQLLPEVLNYLRQMIEGVSETLVVRPGRMSKAGVVGSD